MMKHILTIDNLLHLILGVVIVAIAVVYPVGAAALALYLREQGQSDSWTLKWSFHKHAEWVVPSLVLAAIWHFYTF